MKLYYTPGACSLVVHIALIEAGLPHHLVKVDLMKKLTEHGDDYRALNPKGYVPLLVADDGFALTETAVTVLFVADQVAEKNLAPARGSQERYRLLEWLNFIATELHKRNGALYRPTYPQEFKDMVRLEIAQKMDWLDGVLSQSRYLLGETFSVADIYLGYCLNGHARFGIDLSPWPFVTAYREAFNQRPATVAAMKAEGLLG